MSGKYLAVVLAVVGIVLVGVVLGGDPCGGDVVVARLAILLGSVFFGAAAFIVVQARTRRTWIAVTAAIVTAVAAIVGSAMFALIQWAENCSN